MNDFHLIESSVPSYMDGTGTCQPITETVLTQDRTPVYKIFDTLWLELTLTCNLECVHCYANSSPSVRQGICTTDQWLHLLDEAATHRCHRVIIIGGEPTLHPDIIQILSHAAQKEFQEIHLFTNATHLTPGLCDAIESLGIIVDFSFYSFDARTHDKITRKKGSWQKTLKGIASLLARQVPISANIVLMDKNNSHYQSTVDFLTDFGVKDIHVDGVRDSGRGASMKHGKQWEPASIRPLSGKFPIKISIDPDGKAFPCPGTRNIVLGNIGKTPLSDILLSTERIHCIGCQYICKEIYDEKNPTASRSSSDTISSDTTRK